MIVRCLYQELVSGVPIVHMFLANKLSPLYAKDITGGEGMILLPGHKIEISLSESGSYLQIHRVSPAPNEIRLKADEWFPE